MDQTIRHQTPNDLLNLVHRETQWEIVGVQGNLVWFKCRHHPNMAPQKTQAVLTKKGDYAMVLFCARCMC